MRTLEERFWEKINIGNEDECWEWTASCSSDGYGQMWRGKDIKGHLSSHRFSWELHNGRIENGFFVLHKCDNKLCVNPNHLFLGTQLDNIRDMDMKGRRVSAQPYGENSGTCKFTDEKIRQIREKYSTGQYLVRELSDEFGVSTSHVSAIVHNKIRKKE